MKPDVLFALFVAKLQKLNIGMESEDAMRALMAYIVTAEDNKAIGLLTDGMGYLAELPTDQEGYFKMTNEWRGIPEALEAFKAEKWPDPMLIRNIGYSALQDAQIYAELMEDKKAREDNIEALRRGEHGAYNGANAETKNKILAYYGLIEKDIRS